MPRMSILNAEEKQEFDFPPVFNSVQRKQYFEVTPRLDATLDKLQSPTNEVCFLLITGYFKATKRFFGRRFHDRDVVYAATKLGFLPELIAPDEYGVFGPTPRKGGIGGVVVHRNARLISSTHPTIDVVLCTKRNRLHPRR